MKLVITIHRLTPKSLGQNNNKTIPITNKIKNKIGFLYEISGLFKGLYGAGFSVENTTGAPKTSILSSINKYQIKARQKAPCLYLLHYFVNFFSLSIAFAACKLCSKASLFLIEKL